MQSQNVSEISLEVKDNNSTVTQNVTIFCIARQANPQPRVTVLVGNTEINKYGEEEIYKGINGTVTAANDDGIKPYYPDFFSVAYKFEIPFRVSDFQTLN